MNSGTMEFIKKGEVVTGLRCLLCDYKVGAGQGMQTEEKWEGSIKSHSAQHSPGRAPNLRDVGYELVFTLDCTICPAREGYIRMTGESGMPEGLVCETCGTEWDADGELGKTKQDPDTIIPNDPRQLKLFEGM